MAAPTYGTDLATVNLAETTTGWSALGGGASGLSASPDIAIQGTNCVDKQITNAEKGQVFDNGAGITNGANNHFFIWISCTTPGLIDTYINRGLTAVIGSSTGNYVQYHLTGVAEFKLEQAFKCWPIRYLNTSSTSRPRRTLTGTPTTTPQVVGAVMKTTASVKGANLGVDGLRRGTGFYITAGDGTTPGTFAGCAAIDLASRYGILQGAAGNFNLQGRFVVGQNTSGTPTAAHFVDSGGTLLFVDTEHSQTDFTQVIIDHASTIFTLSNYTFKALGTNNPGRLVFNNASTVASLTGCTFDGMGTTVLRAGVTATDCTWRNSGLITQNGATIAGGIIDNTGGASGSGNKAVLTANPSLITGVSFVRGSSGHGIEITTPGTYNLTDITTSGYAATNGSTGTEFIYNNSGGAVTLNQSGGGGNLSYRNGSGASTTVNAAQVVMTLTNLPANCEIRIYEDSATAGVIGTVELQGAEDHGTGSTYAYSYSYVSDKAFVAQVLKANFEEFLFYGTLGNTSQSVQVQLVPDNNL